MQPQHYARFKFRRNRPSRCRDLDAVPMHVHAPMKPPATPYYVTTRLTIFHWLCLSVSNHPPNMSTIGPLIPEIRWCRVHVRTCTNTPLMTCVSQGAPVYPQHYAHFKFQCNRPSRSRDLGAVPMHVHAPMKPPATSYAYSVTTHLTVFIWLCQSGLPCLRR